MNAIGVVLSVMWLAAPPASPLVARVNQTGITEADVEFTLKTRQVPAADRARETPRIVEELIDRQLIRDFLAQRKITAPADEIDFQIQQAERVIRQQGEDPAVLLPRLGYTPDRLKSELGLPLAWQRYARQTITLPQTKAYFDTHRAELDGTRIRARQILIKLPSNSDAAHIDEATRTLKDLKSRIANKSISFADAAREFSQAPTRELGGDLGVIGFRGTLPQPVARAAFALEKGELSDPVVSKFGVHLVETTERFPGELSLEDVRPRIMELLSQALWEETVQRERQSARIERGK